MPFIPHTDKEIKDMLATIGAASIEDLFDEIPEALRIHGLTKVPDALAEHEVARLMRERAARDDGALCFIGAGAYEHHIPAAVWEITTRGEFYSAYTPYQAEASQGTLQVIYEYQTMMANLMGMEVSNASLYDGASALAEAVLMAVRANRKSKSKKVLVLGGVNPTYRKVADAIVATQGITFDVVDFDPATGVTAGEALAKYDDEDITAIVIQQPNFFGNIEAVDGMVDWAAANKAVSIAVVNPTAMALLKAPGEWGENGADIACGDGQPLGAPLSSGGPYFGFMTCKQVHVRQMPGRIVGRTVDLDGKEGFALTLQAREQHIRRSKATSNICTNQGLLVTAATIYMSIMGPAGLKATATQSHVATNKLADALTAIDGVERIFSGATFHEVAIRLPKPATEVLAALAERGILGGYDLSTCDLMDNHSEIGNAILVCATELRTEGDIAAYAAALAEVLA